MRIKTALNKRDSAITKLDLLMDRVERYGMKNSDIVAKIISIRKTIIGKCPRWVGEYYNGYADACFKKLEKKLVFFYEMPNGDMVSVNRNRPDYYMKFGYGPKEVTDKCISTGYYWDINGALKPFFVQMAREESNG
jgi:hypothetical protein